MVRRNSNQRITKIKRDIDLDLLKQAELIPVEQGCTVMNPGDNLIPYPTINNLRSWVRKYLLSGINGIFISGYNKVAASAYYYVGNAVFYYACPPRKEEWAAGYLKFTTILDGLVINTQEAKVIDYDSTYQENENVPKPGLQLSNFHHLWEHTLTVQEQGAGSTQKTARIFREWSVYQSTPNGAGLSLVGTVIPTWIGVGYLQDSQTSYSYSWHYWDTDGILAQNNQKADIFIWPSRQIECSADLGCPKYYYYAKVDWWNNMYRGPGWRTFWTMPINVNNKSYILSSGDPKEIESNILFNHIKGYNFPSGVSFVCTGQNYNLSQELLNSPYSKAGSIDLNLNCSDGVTTKSLSIFHYVENLY